MTITTTSERDGGGDGGAGPSNDIDSHNDKLTHLEPSELGTKE